MKVLFIDNFDSFTYNLVDEFAKRGAEVSVYRSDITLGDLRKMIETTAPDLLVISPGPATPAKAGVCLEAVREFAGKLPIFGVCLGHQVVVEVFGGRVTRAPLPVHGKTSRITHDGEGVFAGQPEPMPVGRYHSLIGVELPTCLKVSASFDGIVMGVRHRTMPIETVQFHPESILTPTGGLLVERTMAWAQAWAPEE
ncbi:MAG: aminodeoxychorismate/anthranilate synthase component II [bacterium]|nr:aminodeoxychorismate/anthranilate synthase component II [bacterium]